MQQFCRSNYTGGHFMGNGFPGIKTSPAGRTIPACGFFIYKTTDPEDLLCFLLTILPMTIVNSN